MGKNMKRVLEYGQAWGNRWLSYNTKHRATREAIQRLETRGLVQTNIFGQFKTSN